LIDNLFGWQRILFHGFSVFQWCALEALEPILS
jgi:hypothetical protein